MKNNTISIPFCARQSGQSDLINPNNVASNLYYYYYNYKVYMRAPQATRLVLTLVTTLTRPNGCVCNKPRAASLCV